MGVTDHVAWLVAPDAPWLASTGAILGPIKKTLLHAHPVAAYFSRSADNLIESLLSFYAPDLPASSRQNNGLPMMDGKDMFFVLVAYLSLVAIGCILNRNIMTQTNVRKLEKRVIDKMGPVFVFQTLYNIAQVCTRPKVYVHLKYRILHQHFFPSVRHYDHR